MPVIQALMADDALPLSLDELREVARFAAACARPVLPLFERACPCDPRPRAALEAAEAFAAGERRTTALRLAALAGLRAGREAQDAGHAAAGEAARAAGHAAGAAFLHPLAKATQVKHILGSAAHAVRAMEVQAGQIAWEERLQSLASPRLRDILRCYPPAPHGGGRIGELMRRIDGLLR